MRCTTGLVTPGVSTMGRGQLAAETGGGWLWTRTLEPPRELLARPRMPRSVSLPLVLPRRKDEPAGVAWVDIQGA